jgi:hypothetical protein
MQQILLTPAAGKRLIGQALAAHPAIREKLTEGTVVIIAGTTNGYIAEEILASIGAGHGLKRNRFIRGITLPPGYKVSAQGRLPDERKFPGDVVIQKGVWLPGKTINDVADSLKEGDIILKGANALDIVHKRAAVLIGNPTGGTIVPSLKALIGRRVRLILPVGLEKRIPGDLDVLANQINLPGAPGWCLLPVSGEVFTEIDALSLLTGVRAEIFAAGGICGAEGSVYLLISGTASQEKAAGKIVKSIASEPPFSLS